MDSSIGEDFDVERNGSRYTPARARQKQHGKVIDEIERGYLLGDKVLRYAPW
jgi:molecular chaperone GrpE